MAILTSDIADELIRSQGFDVVIPDIYTEIENNAFAGYNIYIVL